VTQTAAAHAVIVLAAGGSSRLGEPKQLLTRDGETLAHRAVRQAMATRPRELIVILGSHGDEVSLALGDLGAELSFNADWQEGLASSLCCAAKSLATHHGPVLILGCDQPALEATHLQQLLVGAARAPSGCAATRHGNAPGTPAVITAAMLHAAGDLRGDRGFGARLAALPTASLWLLDAAELQLDIDDAEDKRAAIACGLLDAPA
jgi:molybdenum cofactor cytidylyltransferase